VSAAAFASAIFAPAKGLIAVALIVAFVTLFAGFFMLITARIAERARPDTTLLSDVEINALRKTVREARAKREAEAAGKPPHR